MPGARQLAADARILTLTFGPVMLGHHIGRSAYFSTCQGHAFYAGSSGPADLEYARLIKAAGVKRSKFHGLRRTCATLLLAAGQPVHLVSERLGHSKVTMTLEVYAHVLPDMQKDAAATLGALLHAPLAKR